MTTTTRAPDMGPCDDPSGCDAPATVHEPRPDHWHDGAWCAEHAPASLLPAFEATFVVTGDDEQDDRGRPRARYISHEFNAATIVRAEVLARQWAERDGSCDFVEIAEAVTPEDYARMAQATRARAWPLGECYEACGREAVHLDDRAGALSVPYCDECLPRGEGAPHV